MAAKTLLPILSLNNDFSKITKSAKLPFLISPV